MARVRDMQGVPAHLEYLKGDGKRRHPAHCIFHEGVGKNVFAPIHSAKYIVNIAIQLKTVTIMRRKNNETVNLRDVRKHRFDETGWRICLPDLRNKVFR